mgnify:CR=1 FL=1
MPRPEPVAIVGAGGTTPIGQDGDAFWCYHGFRASASQGKIDLRMADSGKVVAQIADIAVFPWMRNADKRGINMAEYPHAQRWFDAINARPAVQRALQVLSDVNNTAPHDEKSSDIMFGKTQFQRR